MPRLGAVFTAVVAGAAVTVACQASGNPRSIADRGASDPAPVPVDGDSAEHDDQSWGPLTVVPVVDPRHYGAGGDGLTDDTEALQAAVDSLADAGGIVWFDEGMTYKTTDVIRITSDHVKLWAPNGQAAIMAATEGRERRQALIVDGAENVGLFGLRLRSDADRRLAALEDSAVVADGATRTELVGLEITDSASAAVLVFDGSEQTFIDGNSIHHTWADGIHFTDGAEEAWVWNNQFFTDESRPGDDGVACVTYGSSPRCRAMEWWNNTHLGSGWGRGLAVVGGEDITIHHNTIRRTGAAGILVASEPSYDTPGSNRITIYSNVIVEAGHAVPHPGILVSGLAGPITNVSVLDNVVVTTDGREAFRTEGEVENLRHSATSVNPPGASVDLDADRPFRARVRDTSVLATRDVGLVASRYRPGLYRTHVRREPHGPGFQQRFEYVVAGQRRAVERAAVGNRGVSAVFAATGAPAVGGEHVLVVRTTQPIEIDGSLRAVGFEELRALSSQIPDLWSYLDAI